MELDVYPPAEALAIVVASIGRKERSLLCGDPSEREQIGQRLDFGKEHHGAILKATSKIDVVSWLERQISGTQDWLDLDRSGLEDLTNAWPVQSIGGTISLHQDTLTNKPLPSVLVAKLVVEEPWEIPAHVMFGGWNECPEPSIQCAIWQHWYENYGAEIVGLSDDVLESQVRDRPATQNDAMKLAWEQYVYCSDLVDQGTYGLSHLAATLKGGNVWGSWWD